MVLHIPCSGSLKERRSVVRSLKERIRNRFNVSVIECSEDNKWQKAQLGFALAAVNASAALQSKQDIIAFISEDGRADIIDTVIYGEDT